MKINLNYSIKNVLIAIIILIGAILRLWNLSSNPPSLTPDEAALGYNAYSVLKTGRDEYGEFLPLIFKSFGDFKPGFYVYSAVPFIGVFGLNEFAVRLPSAISGIITLILIYLLTIELKKSSEKKKGHPEVFVLFVAATNPWLIHFSRGAWEANLALMLVILAGYFFIKMFEKPKFIILSSLFFGLTFITYQGAKLSATIAMIILVIVYKERLFKFLKDFPKLFLVSLILGVIIASPAFLSFFRGETGRLAVFSVFNYPRPHEYTEAFLSKAGESRADLVYPLFHSESLNFARGILGRFYNHISGSFLFFEGDYQNPNLSAPNHGVLLLISVLLIPFGIIYLIRKRGRLSTFTFLWLALSPLPAILSRDQVQSVRALNMAIPWIIVSGVGMWWIFELFNNVKSSVLRNSGIFTIIFTYLLSLIFFLDAYFVHLPVHNARYWHYGFKEAVLIITPIQADYEKVIFQQGYSQPYIYFLFYQKYDPAKYQKQADIEIIGSDVGLVKSLDNIEFQFFSWTPDTQGKKTLIVGNTVAIPDEYSKEKYSLLEEIWYPDQLNIALRIVETQ